MKWLAGVLLVLALAQVLTWQPSEPFFNNDETRHVMTGVFFRDLLVDLPLDRLRSYAVEYYLQYPALGVLVWPPLFYGIEGLFMLVFGTSFLVAKALVGLFSAMACAYLFLLVRRTHGTVAAVIAALLLGLSPMVFQLSRQVMLEMPALAFALAAVFYFVRYLDLQRRSDVFLAAAASAAFALTRYDAHFLLLFFLLCLLCLRRFDLLRRREVWLASALALAVVVPIYLPMLREFGRTHFRVTVQGGSGLGGLWYYSGNLPGQIGWALLVPALVGLVSALRPERRRATWPYLALTAATWLAFAPLAELQVRHSIYWVPAFALFAVEGIEWIASRTRTVVAVIVVCAALWTVVRSPSPYVRGYETAAQYVVANTGSRFSFMDGFLNGGFIYQVRRHDPGRRLWILRGDKILYGVLNDPRSGYKEYAGGEAGILDILFRYDPDLIVVEEPQVIFETAMASRLRRTLATHPERFELVRSFPVESNVAAFEGVRLDVYRSKLRNPSPVQRVSFDMIGLGRSLGTDLR